MREVRDTQAIRDAITTIKDFFPTLQGEFEKVREAVALLLKEDPSERSKALLRAKVEAKVIAFKAQRLYSPGSVTPFAAEGYQVLLKLVGSDIVV